MTWIPTDSFLKGIIIKSFLPNDKHPNLRNINYQNLYPGDQVFIFETNDDKWARGYVIQKPFPNDFIVTSVNLDALPLEKISTCIFPLKYVKIECEIPFDQVEINRKFNNYSNEATQVPSIKDSEKDYKDATGSWGQSQDQSGKEPTPQLPAQKDQSNENILDEIKYSLELLNSHIFTLYSMGEFRLFSKLSQIYFELHETRIKLVKELLTDDEAQVARETATYLLNKIPKKLASKAARLNSKSYDLENENSDTSGYKSILSRDAETGEVLTLETATPSRIALNNELSSLLLNFPINAHHSISKYSLKPPKNKKFYHEPPSHILVDFKSVSGSSAYQPPGFAGMIAYMYIRNNKKRLTEAFAVHTNSVDDLVQVEKISAALFRNLPASEIDNNRVYLVVVLTEEIDLNLNNTHLPSIKRVKKGVAAGVADITRIFSRNEGSLQSGEAHHFSIKLFGSYMNRKPSTGDIKGVVNNGWGELVDRIISGSSHGVAVNPRAEKLVVTVKEFKHQFNGSNNVNQISSSAPISRIKPIFFDPLAENYERIYLSMGKVSLLNNNTKDDLLTLEIHTPNNELITFAKASNQQEKRHWQFISIFPDEAIGEIVKINGVALKNNSKKIPKDDHIILSLFVNGVLAGEGRLLYKSGNRLVEFNKKKTHTIEIISTAHNIPMAHVEINTEYIGKVFNSDISIDNIFQYERFFQLGQKGIEELSNSLATFTKLGIAQLVKYFPELLSSLYGIIDLAANHSGPCIEILDDNTFKAVVHLLDTTFGIQDEYFHLMDNFEARYVRSDQVGIFLLTKIGEIFARVQSNWNSVSRAVCRIMSILMRLSISAIKKVSEKDNYFRLLNQLFKNVAQFLTIDSLTLIDDQTLLMDIVDYVFAFRVNLDETKILKFMITFIDSIGSRGLGVDEPNFDGSSNQQLIKQHKLVINKLLLILRLLNTSLTKQVDTQSILISKAVVWSMDIFLGPTDIEASRLACSIIISICNLLSERINNNNATQNDIELCFSLTKFLPAISSTFIKYNKITRGNGSFKPKRIVTQLFPMTYPFTEFSIDSVVNDEILVEILVELATCFTSVARIGKKASGNEGLAKVLSTHIENDFFDSNKYLVANFESEDILTVISGIRYMRLGKYYPDDKWLSLAGVIAEGCLCALELIRTLILTYQLPTLEQSEMFDRILWGNYFRSLLKLAVVPSVAIEHLSDIPKRACHAITKDVRSRIAFLINEAWDSLAWDATEEDVVRFNLKKFGGYQVEFINGEYGILSDLMLFALQRDQECQAVSVKILWTIIISEYILSENLKEVEKQCLLGLHEIYHKSSYKPSMEDQNNFIDRLKATIRLDGEDVAFGLIYGFIKSFQAFCSTLNYYSSVPIGSEFDEDRTFHEIKLLAQIKTSGKPELFNSFINTMYEKNLYKNDYVQAALSLELLASTYEWDHHKIVPMSFRPKLPEQSSFERKEILYKMIASNFVKGQSLEKAADTYNELLDSYNEHTYDLKSFAYVHNKLAQLYLDLEVSDKLTPNYFRVEAIGTGFPYYMRIIAQIYQGLPFEHITSMHERLLKIFPGAGIISDDTEAQKMKENNVTGRYLHVKKVEPNYEFSDKLFNTTLGVRSYARNKDLRNFVSLKRIPGSTSVFDLWTEETTYECWLSFPTLMNRSFIKGDKTIKLSPLDNAIRTLTSKNDDLMQLEAMINASIKDKVDYSNAFNDLSRQLAGTVDSPVNGGVGQYRLFFTDSKYQNNEENNRKTITLKNAFNDLVIILNRCLILHGKYVPNSMKASHEALTNLFNKNFKEEIEALKLTQDEKITTASRISIFQDKRSTSNSSIINGGNGSSITAQSIPHSASTSKLHRSLSNSSSSHRSEKTSTIGYSTYTSTNGSGYSGLPSNQRTTTSNGTKLSQNTKKTAINGDW
ncbi:unnamed protein product [Candida verbasci]|uniref:DOCKER domain-containing protein n=1 Tax=Candida verbasci TaxID=1227364 RepID=A0A9W4X8T5_9ASCO|nr:unnamed protein product [Candida verbasci]